MSQHGKIIIKKSVTFTVDQSIWTAVYNYQYDQLVDGFKYPKTTNSTYPDFINKDAHAQATQKAIERLTESHARNALDCSVWGVVGTGSVSQDNLRRLATITSPDIQIVVSK